MAEVRALPSTLLVSFVFVLDRPSLISSGFTGQNALLWLLGRSLFPFFILYLFYFAHRRLPFTHACTTQTLAKEAAHLHTCAFHIQISRHSPTTYHIRPLPYLNTNATTFLQPPQHLCKKKNPNINPHNDPSSLNFTINRHDDHNHLHHKLSTLQQHCCTTPAIALP